MATVTSVKIQVSKKIFPLLQKRTLFHWINLQFNSVDEDRRKQFGPDRTCAEWILRNGGTVKWTNTDKPLSDYNELPKEGTVLYLEEVDASESSIMHNGFVHFIGCDHIKKVTLHKCNYLEDEALSQLSPLQKTLTNLQVSSCPNITETGLGKLNILKDLKQLLIFDLPYVKDKAKVVETLKTSLPQCNVTFK